MPQLKQTYCQCPGCHPTDPCNSPPSGCVCGANFESSGGDEGYDHTFTLSGGDISYSVTVAWNFYTVKDQIQIYVNGSILFDSGCVNGTGSYDFTMPVGATSMRIVIIPACEGGSTIWDFDVSCQNPAP